MEHAPGAGGIALSPLGARPVRRPEAEMNPAHALEEIVPLRYCDGLLTGLAHRPEEDLPKNASGIV